MDTKTDNFGLRLRSLIEKKGIAIDAFADEFGIARSTAHLWLNRGASPLEKHWQKLADFFGVSLSYISRGIPELSDSAVREDSSPYGTAATIRGEILTRIQETIRLAGNDVGKLGWLREQVIRHASAPEHWDIHAQIEAEVDEEHRLEIEAAERERQAHSQTSRKQA